MEITIKQQLSSTRLTHITSSDHPNSQITRTLNKDVKVMNSWHTSNDITTANLI